jgi:hypothetical protein
LNREDNLDDVVSDLVNDVTLIGTALDQLESAKEAEA